MAGNLELEKNKNKKQGHPNRFLDLFYKLFEEPPNRKLCIV